jgi:hypothetical protein
MWLVVGGAKILRWDEEAEIWVGQTSLLYGSSRRTLSDVMDTKSRTYMIDSPIGVDDIRHHLTSDAGFKTDTGDHVYGFMAR